MTEQLNGTDDFECTYACVIERQSQREKRERVCGGEEGDVIFLVSSASKVLFPFNTFSYWSISPFLWSVFVQYLSILCFLLPHLRKFYFGHHIALSLPANGTNVYKSEG